MDIRSFLFVLFLSLITIYETQAQCNNLLVNGDASAGLTGWTFSSGTGYKWELKGNDYGNAFTSSYEWCTLEQTIDLVSIGYTEQYLDQEPLILFSQMFKGRYTFTGDSNDLYDYNIELLDGAFNIIDSIYYGTQSFPLLQQPVGVQFQITSLTMVQT